VSERPAEVSHTLIEDVAAQVPIPEDGTLSRVVYSDDQIRVVAFAFDEGQELTEHTAGVPVVLQVVSGKLQVAVEDREETLTQGGWMHLDASIPHSVVAPEPAVLLLTLLRG
jgi:quercetin dioxygenase-like cupin family protein